jgi:hypothetical protein
VLLHALQLSLSPSSDVFVCPLHTLQVSNGAPHFVHFIFALLVLWLGNDATTVGPDALPYSRMTLRSGKQVQPLGRDSLIRG